jgi:YaiO family outer membrane protein
MRFSLKFQINVLIAILLGILGHASTIYADNISSHQPAFIVDVLAQNEFVDPKENFKSFNSPSLESGKIEKKDSKQSVWTNFFNGLIEFFDSNFFQKNKIQQLLDAKEFAQAENELKVLLEKDPENMEYLKVYATVLHINGKYDQTIKTYSKIIERFPRDMDSISGRGRTFLAKGDHQNALKDFNHILARQKDNQDALQGVADIKRAVQYTKQVEAKKKLNQQRDQEVKKAQELEKSKSYSRAIKIYSALIEKNKNDLEAKIYLARAMVLNGEVEKARFLYEKLKKTNPENSEILIGEGFLLAKEDKTEASMKNFQKAIRLDPNNKDALRGINLLNERAKEERRLASIKRTNKKLELILMRADKLINFKDYTIAENLLAEARMEFPENFDIVFHLARVKVFKKKYSESSKLLTELINKKTTNADYLNLRGRVYLATGKLKLAELDFRKVLAGNIQDKSALEGMQRIENIKTLQARKKYQETKYKYLQAQLKIIKALAKNKKYIDIIQLCEAALEKYPDALEIQINLAKALTLNSNLKEAENLYSTLIEKSPPNSELFIGRGFLYLRKSQLALAQESFLEAQRIDSANKDANTGLLLVKERMEKDIIASYLDNEWGKANSFIADNNFEDAVQLYRKILNRYPQNLDTKFYLARAYRLAGKVIDAENILDELVKTNPSNPDIWVEKGQIYSLKGDFDLSEQSFARALSLRSNDREIENRLTQLDRDKEYKELVKNVAQLEKNNEFLKAESQIRELLGKNPENLQIKYMLARNLRLQTKYDHSIAILNTLLNDDPDNVDFLASRGSVWRYLYQIDKAKGDYERALAIEPDRVDLLLGRGNVSVLEKEYFEAKKYFQEALILAPSSQEAKEALVQIENFVRGKVVESFYVESFSGGRDSRTNQSLEWIHPFTSKFRGNIGFASVFVTGDSDHTGFIGGNYDIFDDLNVRGKFSFSPDPDIVAKQTYETEITKSLKEYSMETFFMHRFMEFEDLNFHLISPGINYYWNEKTQVLFRGYFGFQKNGNSRSAFLNIKHDINTSLSAYIGGSIGNESFRILSGADTQVVNSISMQTGFEWRVSDHVSVGLNYVHEEREGQFNRNQIGIVIPLRF